MKKGKLFYGLLLVAMLVLALVLVPGVLAAGSYAQINSVEIVGQTVVIEAEVPCPNTAEATTKVDSTSIRVTVHSVPNPLAGVCEEGAPPVVVTLNVNVSLSQPKDVFVLHGKMYP